MQFYKASNKNNLEVVFKFGYFSFQLFGYVFIVINNKGIIYLQEVSKMKKLLALILIKPSFWEETLEGIKNIQTPNEYVGEKLAYNEYKKEQELRCEALKTELNANLNSKSW